MLVIYAQYCNIFYGVPWYCLLLVAARSIPLLWSFTADVFHTNIFYKKLVTHVKVVRRLLLAAVFERVL